MLQSTIFLTPSLDLAAAVDRRLLRNIQVPVSFITGPGSFSISDLDNVVLANAAAGAVTLTLPSAVGLDGMIFQIKKSDLSSNAVVVNAQPGEFIDGASSVSMQNPMESLIIVSDGSNWQILSEVTGSTGATIAPVFTGIHTTKSATFVTAAGWVMNMNNVSGSLQLRWNQSVVPSGSAEVRVFDATGSSSLGSLLVNSTGLKSFPVTNPSGVRLLRLEHRVASGTGSSEIEDAVLEG
jgi:hypothetical protein